VSIEPESPREGRLTLPDGRTLAYAEYGDPAGRPLFFMQGAPSSRLFHHPDASIARGLGVRLILADRPGFGLSTFQPGRRILDWPADVAALADALGIGRFAVAGISAGGPYAAACAYAIPQRLTRVGLIAAGGPPDAPGALTGAASIRRIGYHLGRRAPWLLRPLFWLTMNPGRDPERFSRRYAAGGAPADEEIMARPEIHAMFMCNYAEATRAGVRGFAWEVGLMARPWAFRLEEIVAPVTLWHGELDASTPPAMARYMAQAIPGCRATFLPNQGHLFIFDHWGEMLAALTGPSEA